MRHNIEWWDKFRDKTFDRLAVRYCVEWKQVEGVDYFSHHCEDGGTTTSYPDNDFLGNFKKIRDYRDEAKKVYPVRWFLLYKLPNIIERTLNAPWDWYDAIEYWIRMRTTQKYHIVKTGRKPGYADVDKRLEGAIWTLLVDFVEVEGAWMNVVFDDEKAKQWKIWNIFGGSRKFRSREQGLEYLDFHIKCGIKTEENEYPYPPEKVAKVQAVKDAYLWYKDVRPQLVEDIEKMSNAIFENEDKTNRAAEYTQLHNLEENLYDLDSKYMKDVVESRSYMWT